MRKFAHKYMYWYRSSYWLCKVWPMIINCMANRYIFSILFNTQMNDAEINVQIYEQIYVFISKCVMTLLSGRREYLTRECIKQSESCVNPRKKGVARQILTFVLIFACIFRGRIVRAGHVLIYLYDGVALADTCSHLVCHWQTHIHTWSG